MSVVVSLTYSQNRRDRLVSLRNGFTYISNLSALIIAIIFLLIIDGAITLFRLLAYTLTGLGLITSIFFIIGVPEATLSKQAIEYDKAYKKANGGKEDEPADKDRTSRATVSENVSSWTQWLSNGAFYIHALVYMFARMAVNVTMTLTPFYLLKVLEFEGDEDQPTPPEIVTVPLASYFTSMVFSILFYGRLVRAFGNRLIPLFIGVIITCIASIPFIFMKPSFSWLVYIAVSIQGVGLSIMLNIATSLISDVIGDDDNSSAFVYGAYSL